MINRATYTPIQLASISSDGTRGDRRSGYWGASISADGSTIAFTSDADNLVPNDTNYVGDIFVYQRLNGLTTRVNLGSSGQQITSFASYNPSLSSDGRYVAFQSVASTIVPDDTNNYSDIFVYDRMTGIVSRANVDSSGQQGDTGSYFPIISGDGQFIAFESLATNLVPGDTNAARDIFVHDLQNGKTIRASVGDAGQQSNDANALGVNSISADGRYIAFESRASNLVSGDTNGVSDIFVFDSQLVQSIRVSIGLNDTESDGDSSRPSISADGRYIVYKSTANNLVLGDMNQVGDIFVYDRQLQTNTRVSIASDGTEANATSSNPSITAQGRYVAFESFASNLVRGDSNGKMDVFVHDLATNATVRVSMGDNGLESDEDSFFPSISSDGGYLTFVSASNRIVPAVNNPFHENVFLTTNPLTGVVPNPDPIDAAPARNLFMSLPITLTWRDSANSSIYVVEVDTGSGFHAPQRFTTSGAHYVIIDSLPDGIYYWRVRSQSSDWSVTDTFVLDTTP